MAVEVSSFVFLYTLGSPFMWVIDRRPSSTVMTSPLSRMLVYSEWMLNIDKLIYINIRYQFNPVGYTCNV